MGRPGGQGERQVCPSGSMATFDEPSDDQKGTTDDLKGPMGSRGMFRGPRGRGRLSGRPRGPKGTSRGSHVTIWSV